MTTAKRSGADEVGGETNSPLDFLGPSTLLGDEWRGSESQHCRRGSQAKVIVIEHWRERLRQALVIDMSDDHEMGDQAAQVVTAVTQAGSIDIDQTAGSTLVDEDLPGVKVAVDWYGWLIRNLFDDRHHVPERRRAVRNQQR